MHSISSHRRSLLLSLPLLALASCDEGEGRRHGPGAGIADGGTDAPADLDDRSLDGMFEAIAAEYDVPMPLLQALGHVETRWEMVEGGAEFDERAPAFGIMGMRGDRLEEAAAIAGLDTEQVRTDPVANIRAAAAWLDDRAIAAELDDRSDIGRWADIVAEWSDLEQEWARAAYVYVEVYPRMREGAVELDATGEVRGELEPVEVYPNFTVPPPEPALAAGPDYELSVWRPSPNFSSRPAGNAGKRAMIIIHTCEGAYVGCYSWLASAQSGVSAHYVVNSTGSEISQLVNESKKGWHISATYNCAKNQNHECERNGASSNNFTIGIEHAGFGNQASWAPKLIDESAKLVCDITADNGIARDQYHIVGHGKLQPWNRTDPGPNWPWDEYYDLIDAHCNGGAPPPEPEPEPMPEPEPPPGGGDVTGAIVIDSNNAKNDAALGFIATSNNWVSSTASTETYESGYWYASTAAVSDPATFWFYAAEAGQYTVDAWWTSGTNRSSQAPFVVFDDSGSTKVVKVDQRSNGGKWNQLGTWSFAAGWNKVQLSRWTGGTAVVIADALRVHQ